MTHRFENNDFATVHSTGSVIDGQIVEIIGIAINFLPKPGSIYIISIPDNLKSEYKWDAITMIDSCLTPIEN